MYKYILLFILLIFVSGCIEIEPVEKSPKTEVKDQPKIKTETGIKCILPAIKIADQCCLDSNKDQICDNVETQSDNGNFIVYYNPNTTQETSKLWEQKLKELKFFEEEANKLNQVFNLPYNVSIVLQECGAENAYYWPEYKTIQMCYEFLTHFVDIFDNDGYTGEEHTRLVYNTAYFIFYHELGHALIDIFDLPTTGSEEDSVDEFATIWSLTAQDGEVAADASIYFALEQGENIDPTLLIGNGFETRTIFLESMP